MNRMIAIALFCLGACSSQVPTVDVMTDTCPTAPECVVDEDCSSKPVDCTTGGDASTATAVVPTGTCTGGVCEVEEHHCLVSCTFGVGCSVAHTESQ